MANDCMNTLWFCSMDKNLLQQLFDKFRSCFDTTCEGKVADLLKKHGYSGAEADRRDYITGCDGIISRNEAYYYFQAEIISAWAPHMDVLFKLIRENMPIKSACSTFLRNLALTCLLPMTMQESFSRNVTTLTAAALANSITSILILSAE